MSINDKLKHIKETKGLIRDAIMNKGVLVTEKDSFRSYADKIMDIPQEGGGSNFYEDLYNIRTDNGTDMTGLFARMTIGHLPGIDLSNLDTSKVTNMSYMFDNAVINNLNMNGWDTSNVTDMSYMFNNFKHASLSFPFDTSKVKNMSYMFNGCGSSTIDLAGLDMSSVTNMGDMFCNCPSTLKNIDKLRFPKVTSLDSVFDSYGNSLYTDLLDLSEWDVSNITNMQRAFVNCKVKKIDLSNWNTSKVTNMGYMFNTYTSYLEELIIPDWDMTNVTTRNNFFPSNASYTSKLRFIDLSRSNEYTINLIATTYLPKRTETTYGDIAIPEDSSQEVIDAIIAKYWRPIGPSLDIESFQITAELEEIQPGKSTKVVIHSLTPWYAPKENIEFVSSDESIATIDIQGNINGISEGNVEIYARVKDNHDIISNVIAFSVSEVDSYPNVIKFRGTSKPTSSNYIKVNDVDVKLSEMDYNDATGIYTYDVGVPITKIQFNGYGSTSYGNTITELIKLNIDNITDMSSMFSYCSSLTSLNLSSWDTSNVTSMKDMFYYCTSLTSVDLSSWVTGNVTSMKDMFYSCFNLTSLDISSWDTSKVTSMGTMFYFCTSLTSLDLSSWDTGSVTSTYSIFNGCSSLTSLDLSSWDTSKVSTSSAMFANVPSTCSIYVDEQLWTLTESKTDFTGTFIRVKPEVPDYHTEYYTDYTIDTSVATFSMTDTIQDGAYLPELSNGHTYILLKLNNKTETTDLSTEASLVSSIRIYYPEETSYIKFANTKVKEVTHLNGTNITDCTGMFTNCIYLESADLSTLDSSKVVVDETMFEGVNEKCKVEVNDDWNITEEEMGWEGYYNPYFVEYTIAVEEGSTDTLKFKNTSEYLKYIPNMIRGYGTIVDITDSIIIKLKDGNTTDSLDTLASDVESIRIYYPENIERITFGETLSAKTYGLKEILYINIDSITSMYNMFAGCSSLTSLDVSNWDTSNVTEMSGMFDGCSSLTSLDVSNWDTSNVTEMDAMFSDCSSLTSLGVSNWNVGNVENMRAMFAGCSSLTSLDVSNWDVGNVKDTYNTFMNCQSLTSLDLSSWDTSNVTEMSSMFASCSSLTSLDVSKWNTSNVTKMSAMFQNCSSLTSLDVSKWDTGNVTEMSYTFSGCRSLTSVDVSKWNISNVDAIYRIFSYCSSLTSLDLSNWDTSKLTSVDGMFISVSADIDWHYDGNNYTNWTLTEEQTNFSGTFPWNQ